MARVGIRVRDGIGAWVRVRDGDRLWLGLELGLWLG